MKRFSKNVLPVLLGGDLNAYSVALAFREAYGVKSHAFVRYRCGATENSSFIKTHVCADLADVKTAVSVLLKLAAENTGAELFLIPCSDAYVELAQKIKGHLSNIYRTDLPDKELWRRLSDKSDFYSLMEKFCIPYPKCVVFSSKNNMTDSQLSAIDYPAVLKPSDSSEYWRNPFPDMRKVYFVNDADSARKIAERIFDSGYRRSVILQKTVGGKDGNGVLTTYSDKHGRVVRAVLGKVVLEECGKTSYGNHASIITQPLDQISFELIDFLNSVEYTGFANFDIMSDGKKKYVLEVNTRQGRSCDYLRASGVNISRLIVENALSDNLFPEFLYKEIYWHYPSHKTVLKYCSDGVREKIDRLENNGLGYTPYVNEYENLRRRVYAAVHDMRLRKAMKKSMREEMVRK